MSGYAIQIENLSKQYLIGAKSTERYQTLRDTLVEGVKAPPRRIKNVLSNQSIQAQSKTIWALKDINLDIKHGEVIGIIGANGAGKSTLLKILSRITTPTEGRAIINGRLGSLLEVGTGFHPELSGRENIYLNGAILGMRREEIRQKFDEIVDFSGVEEFLDTPVKRYSSGMQVRLAFAVAAHLEPEILVIDEVLSVGDAAFQKKSMGKMGEVAESGRTVLFVSHNMAAVENLCSRGVVLQSGRIAFVGSQTEAIEWYLDHIKEYSTNNLLIERTDRPGNGKIQFTQIDFKNTDGKTISNIRSGEACEIHVSFECSDQVNPFDIVHVGINVFTLLGVPVFTQTTRIMSVEFKNLPRSGTFVCRIPEIPLPPGTYPIRISMKLNEMLADQISNAADLMIVEGDFFGTGKVPSAKVGICLVKGEWRLIG